MNDATPPEEFGKLAECEVRIEATKEGNARIYINDELVPRVEAYSVAQKGGQAPIVKLTLIATSLQLGLFDPELEP